jgi:hypothetical protein
VSNWHIIGAYIITYFIIWDEYNIKKIKNHEFILEKRKFDMYLNASRNIVYVPLNIFRMNILLDRINIYNNINIQNIIVFEKNTERWKGSETGEI